MISEKYDGIRPAPGYPACLDHTEKATLFELLQAEGKLGKIITLGTVLDLAVFWIALKLNKEFIARGVILAVIILTIITVLV